MKLYTPKLARDTIDVQIVSAGEGWHVVLFWDERDDVREGPPSRADLKAEHIPIVAWRIISTRLTADKDDGHEPDPELLQSYATPVTYDVDDIEDWYVIQSPSGDVRRPGCVGYPSLDHAKDAYIEVLARKHHAK